MALLIEEGRVFEEPQVQHRGLDPALDHHEQRQRRRAHHQVRQHAAPRVDAALGEADDQEREARRVGQVAPDIEAVSAALLGRQIAQGQRRPERADNTQRHIEPEHPRPAKGRQRSADDRPQDCADGHHHLVGADGKAEFLTRKSVGDDGAGIGDHEGPAHTLKGSQRGQQRHIAGKTGQPRGQGKHSEAQHVELLTPHHVREAAYVEHKHRLGDVVSQQNPD